MNRRSTSLLQSALAVMHATKCDRLLAPWTRGIGAIFMLHHVDPDPVPAFSPNRILKVTPNFLEEVIRHVRADGFEIVSLDEAHRRLSAPEAGDRPFTCFTFDDGYRDNLVHAYPVLKRHNVPFTIYVAPDFLDMRGELWWLALERVVRRVDRLELCPALTGGATEIVRVATTDEKEQVFHRVYWQLRFMQEQQARAIVADLCTTNGIDLLAPCRDLVMNWDELRILARDPLVTIGAHSMSHLALGKLSDADSRWQMSASIQRIETELGASCQHFCYPYGDPESAGQREFQFATELGQKTAVTTAKGLICACHGDVLTALPRVSLNGDYQDRRYLEVLLSGVPFAVYNAARGAVGWVRRARGVVSGAATGRSGY